MDDLHEQRSEEARAARQNADRVMCARARKRVDKTAADIAAKLRAEAPLPPVELVNLKAEYQRMSADLIELRAAAMAVNRDVREAASDSVGKTSPGIRRQEKAAAAVANAEEARRDVAKRRDELANRFASEFARPYARHVLNHVLTVLQPHVSAMAGAVAALRLPALTHEWQRLADAVAVPAGAAPIEINRDMLEVMHGHAVVIRDALTDAVLLGRDAGEGASGLGTPLLAAARALVEGIASARRRRGYAS